MFQRNKVPSEPSGESSHSLSTSIQSNDNASQIIPSRTVADGNCFFHAVFGCESCDGYKTDKAKEMRKEWYKFLSQFSSFDDKKMTSKLREVLDRVLGNFVNNTSDLVGGEEGLKFLIQEIRQNYKNLGGAVNGTLSIDEMKASLKKDERLYVIYLSAIHSQSYYVLVEEIPMLAALANITIDLNMEFMNKGRLTTAKEEFRPSSKEIIGDGQYVRDDGVWGERKQVTIHLKGNHFSYVKSSVEQSPLKEIINSPLKQSSTSHSKSPGKENAPPRRKHHSIANSSKEFKVPESKYDKMGFSGKKTSGSDVSARKSSTKAKKRGEEAQSPDGGRPNPSIPLQSAAPVEGERAEGGVSRKRGSYVIKNSDSDDSAPKAKKRKEAQLTKNSNQYPVAELKRALHGIVYQLKLLMWFSKHGLDEEYYFKLATEWSDAEKFDDLVFMYKDSNERENYRFLQAKHKQNRGEKITIGHLLTKSKHGEFSLEKYFVSYLKIKKKEVFKDSNLEDFIIYTNIDFDLDDLVQDKVKKLKETKTGKNKGKEVLVEAIDTQDRFLSITGTRYKIKCNDDLVLHLTNSDEVQEEMREQLVGREIEEFFEKLVFATDQPDETELDKILESRIATDLAKKFNCISSLSKDAYSDFQKVILDWMKEKEGKFLPRDDIERIFEELEQKFDTLHQIQKGVSNNNFMLRNIEERQGIIYSEMNSLNSSVSSLCSSVSSLCSESSDNTEGKGRFLPQTIWYNMQDTVRPLADRHQLCDLRNSFMNDEKVVVISGLRGMGKSELARRYAKKYWKDHDCKVVWIDFETQESLKKSFCGLAKELKILKEEGDEIKEAGIKQLVNDIYECFEGTRSLFIFDHAKSYKDIKEFLLPLHSTHSNDGPFVLITSSQGNWKTSKGNMITEIKLSEFEEQEAVKYIRKALSIKHEQEDAIQELARVLEYFPLFLHQAVTYIHKKQGESKERERRQKVKNKSFGIIDYIAKYIKVSASTKFKKDLRLGVIRPYLEGTLQRIKQEDGGINASKMLDIMAFSCNSFPVEIFYKLYSYDSLWLSLNLLETYSVVSINKGNAVILPLFRDAIKMKYVGKESEVLEQAIGLMVGITISNKEENFVAPLWSHIVKRSKLTKEHFIKLSVSSDFDNPSSPSSISSSDNPSSSGSPSISSDEHSQDGPENLLYLLTDFVASIWSHANKQSKLVREYFAESSKFSDEDREDLLYLLVRNHKLQVAKDLLHKIIDEKIPMKIANSKYRYGRTLLHFFAAKNEVKIIKYLIQEQKHDGNTQDNDSKTSFYCAAENLALEVVKYLLSIEKINPNIQDDEKYTPLHRAIENECFGSKRDFVVSKTLINDKRIEINAKGNQEQTALHLASEYNILEIVQLLVDNGANISIKDRDGKKPVDVTINEQISDFLKRTQDELNASLLMAAEKNDLGSAGSSLNRGADINAKNNLGQTVLYRAALCNNYDIVKFLVDNGANISVEDQDGKKPVDATTNEQISDFLKRTQDELNASLLMAAEKNDLGSAGSSLNRGADINAQDKEGDTALHIAVCFCHTNFINFLIGKKGIKINAKGNQEQTALHIAVFCGDYNVVKLLVENGADISIEDQNGKKPIGNFSSIDEEADEKISIFLKEKQSEYDASLLEAAKQKDLVNVQKWLSRGVDVNAKDDEGDAALHIAVFCGDYNVVKLLIENGADISIKNKDGRKPIDVANDKGISEFLQEKQNEYDASLLEAAKQKDLVNVQKWLSRGADVNAKDDEGDTALHIAVCLCDTNFINFLIGKKGIKINAKGNQEQTALHIAVFCGDYDVVKLLVENGANISIEDQNGKKPVDATTNDKISNFLQEKQNEYNTSLLEAAKNGDYGSVEIFLNRGADINVEDSYKCTSLHFSVNSEKVVELLVRKGININAQNDGKQTALHIAVDYGRYDTVEFLVQNNANISIKDGCGEKPVDLTTNDKISNFLQEKQNEYNTSLLEAAKNGDYGSVEIFLNRGADINAQNDWKQTALHIAASKGHNDIIDLLVRNGANTSVQDLERRTPLIIAEKKFIKNPGCENYIKAIDLLQPQQRLQIQSSRKQQKSLLYLNKYIIDNHFYGAELKAVKQGLYLPLFEEREVEIHGKCVAITRGLSQTLFLQGEKPFLSNLKTSAKIYGRIAQGKQVSKREKEEIFALSKLLDDFDQQLYFFTSLSSNLIRAKSYKTFGDLSNYIAGVKGDFAIHLVTSNHVVAIYRIVDDYAYFDCNTAFVSGLKNVDQLMKIVEKATEFAGYEVGEKGFLVEHFDVEKANKLLSSEGKQILAKEIKTERQLLAEQDKELGLIKINSREISRVQLYDFGTKINAEGSVPLLINANMNLSSKKFQDHLDRKEVSMTAREYLDSLKNSKNVEEVVQATKTIPLIGSKREIEEAEQTRMPKQSLLELAKGTINSILAAVSFVNISWSESQLSGKTDNKPETYLNDPIANNQLQRLL